MIFGGQEKRTPDKQMITMTYKTDIKKMSGFVRVLSGFVRSMSGRTPGHISLDMSGLSGLSGDRNAKGNHEK